MDKLVKDDNVNFNELEWISLDDKDELVQYRYSLEMIKIVLLISSWVLEKEELDIVMFSFSYIINML